MPLADVLKPLNMPVELACSLIQKLLGKPFEIAGNALSDQVLFWQWCNRIKIMDKVDKIAKEKKLNPRNLDPDFLMPFIQKCGDVSSETMQDAWARMLAAAIEDSNQEHIAFVNTLASMTTNDVKVLQAMIENGFLERQERAQPIADKLNIGIDVVKLSIANFEQLGFFTPTQSKLKPYAIIFIKNCIADQALLDSYLAKQAQRQNKMVFD